MPTPRLVVDHAVRGAVWWLEGILPGKKATLAPRLQSNYQTALDPPGRLVFVPMEEVGDETMVERLPGDV